MNRWVRSTKRFILASAVTVCDLILAFAFLFGIPTGITCAAVRLNICALTAGIKKCKSTINNSNKKQWIVLLAKIKLNTIEALFSRALFDSYISHGEFVLWNNVLWKYDDTKEETKNVKASKVH